ncbi:MAG: hypothetical protein LDL33_15705, partial [Desulfomonile sp.]|nr:hypothetical protein [Desulfomonile sp.]
LKASMAGAPMIFKEIGCNIGLLIQKGQNYSIFLRRKSQEGDRQRGILILDESAHETTLQKWLKIFASLELVGAISNILQRSLYS